MRYIMREKIVDIAGGEDDVVILAGTIVIEMIAADRQKREGRG